MSHNVTITGVKIHNLDALERACAELRAEGVKITLQRGSNRSLKFRTYRGGVQNDDTADCVIRLGEIGYDIGLVRQPGGHYQPVYDNALGISVRCPIACEYKGNFNHHVIVDEAETALASKGVGIGKLMQRYTAVVTEMEAKRKGYLARRVTNPNGTIQVLINVQ